MTQKLFCPWTYEYFNTRDACRNDTLFIVLTGFMQVTDSKRNKVFMLDKGDRFGESDVLRPRIQKMNVCSMVFSELVAISSETLQACSQDFPIVQKRLRAMARQIAPDSVNVGFLQANWDDNQALLHSSHSAWNKEREEKTQLCVLRWGAYTERLLRFDAAANKTLRLKNRAIEFSHSIFKTLESSESSCSEDELMQGAAAYGSFAATPTTSISVANTPRFFSKSESLMPPLERRPSSMHMESLRSISTMVAGTSRPVTTSAGLPSMSRKSLDRPRRRSASPSKLCSPPASPLQQRLAPSSDAHTDTVRQLRSFTQGESSESNAHLTWSRNSLELQSAQVLVLHMCPHAIYASSYYCEKSQLLDHSSLYNLYVAPHSAFRALDAYFAACSDPKFFQKECWSSAFLETPPSARHSNLWL